MARQSPWFTFANPRLPYAIALLGLRRMASVQSAMAPAWSPCFNRAEPRSPYAIALLGSRRMASVKSAMARPGRLASFLPNLG